MKIKCTVCGERKEEGGIILPPSAIIKQGFGRHGNPIETVMNPEVVMYFCKECFSEYNEREMH